MPGVITSAVPVLQPNDESFDNGPAIADLCANGLTLPVGKFYVSTTIEVGAQIGGYLKGQASMDRARIDSAWDDEPCTVIIWNGDDGSSVFRISASRFRVEDLGVMGMTADDATPFPSNDMIAFELVDPADVKVNCGLLEFNRVTVGNSNIGWYCSGENENHVDHIYLRGCTSHASSRPYVIDNPQSVNHFIELEAGGNGETILDVLRGGRVKATIGTTGSWDRLIGIGDAVSLPAPSTNNGWFDIYLLMDGGDEFGTLVEERVSGGLSRVKIRGFRASTATITSEPIMLAASSVYDIVLDGNFGGYRRFVTGSGYEVTQGTSITTGVEINQHYGEITTVAASTAAGAEDTFTVSNSQVEVSDIILTSVDYTGDGTPLVVCTDVSAGSFKITISNLHSADALSALMVIKFAIQKGPKT